MSARNILTLRQAAQARTDFALIEEHLEFLAGQLARIPTRKEQARNTLGIIFATATLTTLAVLWFTGYWRYSCDEGRPHHRRGYRGPHFAPAFGKRASIA